MTIVIVSDIFGKTPALCELAEQLSTDKTVEIIDPYQGKYLAFENEAQAYQYFQNHVGIEQYCSILSQKSSIFDQCGLIAFSVGATVAWRLSEHLHRSSIKQMIGFYGSQIRHFTEVKPQIEVELIFPRYEAHFNVQDLSSTLNQNANVTSTCVDYLHGFMNKHSENFHQEGYLFHMNMLKKCFK